MAGKHYPFVSYTVNLERLFNQAFTVIKNNVMCDVWSNICIACHQTLAVWGEPAEKQYHSSSTDCRKK